MKIGGGAALPLLRLLECFCDCLCEHGEMLQPRVAAAAGDTRASLLSKRPQSVGLLTNDLPQLKLLWEQCFKRPWFPV